MLDIMIPFWGDPDLLMAALGSVRAQTSAAWRCVVVDDCYPVDVAGRIAALDDERITYVRNEQNLGITNNYRRCVELATAEWMCFFGCDDLMEPTYVAVMEKAAAAYPRAAVIAPRVAVVDENGDEVKPLRDRVKQGLLRPRGPVPVLLEGEEAATKLLTGDWLYWPSLTFRRAAIAAHDFRDDFPIIQDLAVLIDIVLDGGALLSLPAQTFRYRRHSASASSASAVDGRRMTGERRYLDLAAALMEEQGWPKAARAARLRLLSRLDAVTLLPAALKARNKEGLRVLIDHAVSVRPLAVGDSGFGSQLAAGDAGRGSQLAAGDAGRGSQLAAGDSGYGSQLAAGDAGRHSALPGSRTPAEEQHWPAR